MISGKGLWQENIERNMANYSFNGREYYTYHFLPDNLYEALKNTTLKFPDRIAIINNQDTAYTFSELLDLIDQFSAYLTKVLKVKKGNHVALMMYNTIEFCVSFISLCKIGAVSIPLPSKYKEIEIDSLAEKADLDFIICDEQFCSYFGNCIDNQGQKIPMIVSINSDYKYGFSHLLSPESVNENSEGTLEDPVIIMFTSGTTSQSKGVIIHNYNMMHAIISYQRIFNLTETDKSIIATPIYHVTGLVALLGLFIFTGGCLYLHKFFNATRLLECVLKNDITFIHASPTVFYMLLEEKQHYPILSSLKQLACGSSNMPIEKLRQYNQWLPNIDFHTVYGLTETTSPCTIFPYNACTSQYIGSSGIPIPGVEIKIISNEGNELANNEIGEIYVRGSVVIESYYKCNTNLITEDGWLKTGDLGYFNSEKYLYIVDRKKDMINRGGEKIWSFDVENELCKVPGVLEAAVVGIPDQKYGEVPVALIRVNDDFSLTEKGLKDLLLNNLAKYQVPKMIHKVNTIPKTPNDKVDKKYIRQILIQKMEGSRC